MSTRPEQQETPAATGELKSPVPLVLYAFVLPMILVVVIDLLVR